MIGAPLQPTLKAASTAQHSQLSAVASSTPTTSRAASPARPRKVQKPEVPNNDYLSEKATLSLVRRVLIIEQHGNDRATPGPIEGVLPPLTSSNDVDIQLYAIISVVVKDFIQPWYSKITPDHSFVEEVVHIIAHCSRALEQRLRHIDVAELTLNEIPALFEQHTQDLRTATLTHNKLSYGTDVVHAYHALNPHPALDPDIPEEERVAAERAYRQLLIQGALVVLLPTEDLQNSSLRILVTDIIADLILGRAINDRLCHGWFLHEMVSKVATIINRRVHPKITGEEIQADARGRLEKFGLLTNTDLHPDSQSRKAHQSLPVYWFWAVLQWMYMAVVGIRIVTRGLLQARHMPARTRTSKTVGLSPGNDQRPPMVLDYCIFSTLSVLLNLSSRMPWLVGVLAFFQHVLTSGQKRPKGIGSIVDRFLHTTLTQHLLPPSLLPTILINLRATLFPHNSLGPPAPPPPSQEEALIIRATAARNVLALLPKPVVRVVFATPSDDAQQSDPSPPQQGGTTITKDEEEEKEEGQADLEEILALLSDERLNKYWIYGMLELIIVRLCPELLTKTPGELMAERGVEWGVSDQNENKQEADDSATAAAKLGEKLDKVKTHASQKSVGSIEGMSTGEERVLKTVVREQQSPQQRQTGEQRKDVRKELRNERLRVVTNGS